MIRLRELRADSEVDNVLLEIRLARELYKARGEDAFQVLPCFLGPLIPPSPHLTSPHLTNASSLLPL